VRIKAWSATLPDEGLEANFRPTFFSFHSASRPTPDTFTTLNRTPGISPFALPFRPKPEMRTSSFSSTKLRQPSLGTKAVTFFPFLMSCTRTHFRIAEFGCLASTPTCECDQLSGRLASFRYSHAVPIQSTFSSTIPFAWDEPPVGDDL
jgi:hypothetical protein